MMPTIQVDGKLATVFTDAATYWFSYNTLVAFAYKGEKYVSKNVFSATTGKHLNKIDGGDTLAKSKRLNRADFENRYKQLTKSDKMPAGILG